MSQHPAPPPGLQVYETRLYFDPETGNVLSVHQLVSAPGEQLSSEEIDAEMSAFEESVRKRHSNVDFLVVEPGDLNAGDEGLSVDVKRRSLVRR